MSMTVQVKVVIKNMTVFQNTVEKLGYKLMGTPTERLTIETNEGTHICSVYKNSQGQHQLFADEIDLDSRDAKTELMHKIKQEYAYAELMETVRTQGWTAETHTDGESIRVRVAI